VNLTAGALLPLAFGLLACNPDPHRHFSGHVADPLWKVAGLDASWPRLYRGAVYVTARPPQSEADADWRVYSFDLHTGRALWKSAFVGQRIEAIEHGLLYVSGPTKEAHLAALDAQTGKVIWTSDFAFGRILFTMRSQMLVTEADVNGPAHLLDAATGKPAAPPADNMIVKASLVDGVLYTISWLRPKHFLTAWDSPGHELWRTDLPNEDFSGPLVVGDNVFYNWDSPPNGFGIYAFDRKTGARRWVWEQQNKRELRGIQADANTLFASVYGDKHEAIALDAATGRPRWTVALPWTPDDYYFKRWDHAPQLIDPQTVMYFGQPNPEKPAQLYDSDHLDNRGRGFQFLALERATGKIAWQSTARWKYDWWTIHDGLLFSADDGPHDWTTSNFKHKKDGWIAAADIRTGKELWRSRRQELASLSTPEIEDGILVTSSNPRGSGTEPGIFAYRANRKGK
jgi:outer membrane protein assembly factor BamB